MLYDVGRVLGVNWRPVFDPKIVRRELEIIRHDLHCNAVKICGRDLDRLTFAAEAALALGLEVWFSPELWDKGAKDTLEHITAAAQEAERLRRRSPDRLVFSVATESTLFMRGIIAGRTFRRRLANLLSEVRAGRHLAPLEAFLAHANPSPIGEGRPCPRRSPASEENRRGFGDPRHRRRRRGVRLHLRRTVVHPFAYPYPLAVDGDGPTHHKVDRPHVFRAHKRAVRGSGPARRGLRR
ncbi:hypothetical protein AB0H88_21810 [Nonomuraea sp. NPDC050680]|uniref:hypothetical protein n=1 Tax=Nonomuraea sp. NPDC050680 TaxID=3154630 RepID=UPI003405FBE5